MRSIEDVKALFRSAAIETHPRADKAVLEEALHAGGLASAKDVGRAGTNAWRRIMRSRISKLAAAAVVIGLLVLVEQFGGPGGWRRCRLGRCPGRLPAAALGAREI